MNPKNPATLRSDSNRERINLIEADIETGMTFLRIAITELGLEKLQRAESLLEKARQAYNAMAKLLVDVDEPEEQQRLREKHQALDAMIREVERRKRRYEAQNG